MKPLFPTAVILVCDPNHISNLNSTLMLCERLTLEGSQLGIGFACKLKSPASAPKYPCALLLRKNGSLVKLDWDINDF